MIGIPPTILGVLFVPIYLCLLSVPSFCWLWHCSLVDTSFSSQDTCSSALIRARSSTSNESSVVPTSSSPAATARLNPPLHPAFGQTGLGRVGQSRFTLGQATSMGRRDRPTFLSRITSLRPGNRLRGANPCPGRSRYGYLSRRHRSASRSPFGRARLLLSRNLLARPETSRRSRILSPRSTQIESRRRRRPQQSGHRRLGTGSSARSDGVLPSRSPVQAQRLRDLEQPRESSSGTRAVPSVPSRFTGGRSRSSPTRSTHR